MTYHKGFLKGPQFFDYAGIANFAILVFKPGPILKSVGHTLASWVLPWRARSHLGEPIAPAAQCLISIEISPNVILYQIIFIDIL